MFRRIALFFIMLAGTLPALAQSSPGEGWMDKYLPIAQLFDSPIFFAIVIGSALALLVAIFIVVKYAKHLEKKSAVWCAGKNSKTLVELLDSPIEGESQLAYIHLRHHSGEEDIQLLTERLLEQRNRGNINPTVIYLLEDLQAQQAVPVLQQIASGKSQIAPLAERVATRLTTLLEEEEQGKENKDVEKK